MIWDYDLLAIINAVFALRCLVYEVFGNDRICLVNGCQTEDYHPN